MQVEYILVGQGISGSWLSFYLWKEKKSFLVIDNHLPNAASGVAAGLINPVTGRRIVKTWMIDELLSFIVPAYEELGNVLGLSAITPKTIIDFHPSLQMKQAFEERIQENVDYLLKPEASMASTAPFHFEYGYGLIFPAYQVSLKEILSAWRKKLIAAGQYLDEFFDASLLQVSENGIRYKQFQAEKIIFCDGISSAKNPFFQCLPFSLNKGEALLLEASGIPSGYLYKKSMMLAPLDQNLYWLGSNYQWDYTDPHPSVLFRTQAESHVRNWLKLPFKIIDHVASIRPANLERRPFVGMHPVYKNIGILNGMGTKGCSLAPYFAKQLADHLLYQAPIHPEADIARFQKMLSRR